MSYLPHELVTAQILLRLPVKSLLRFRCVCKAWRDTIADDFFRRAHLRLQSLRLLIAPQIEYTKDDSRYFSWSTEVRTPGLYQWEESQQDDAKLVYTMSDHDSFLPYIGVAHDLAHCDGLVLVPSDAKVRVINPATQSALTLLWSPNISTPRAGLPDGFKGYQAFGLGHDTRSDTYKVARFYYKSLYTIGMEVYTIGVANQHRQWRQTSTPPPYPVIPKRTATFFKASLFWTIQENVLGHAAVAPGFIRFRLEDGSFTIMPPPPCSQRIDYGASSLADLRGELCVFVPKPGPDMEAYEMWVCHDLDDVPRWDRRHVIAGIKVFAGVRFLRPVAAYADTIVVVVIHEGTCHLCPCDRKSQQIIVKDYVSIGNLRYHHTNKGRRFEHQMKKLYDSMVVPYNPSLIPI